MSPGCESPAPGVLALGVQAGLVGEHELESIEGQAALAALVAIGARLVAIGKLLLAEAGELLRLHEVHARAENSSTFKSAKGVVWE